MSTVLKFTVKGWTLVLNQQREQVSFTVFQLPFPFSEGQFFFFAFWAPLACLRINYFLCVFLGPFFRFLLAVLSWPPSSLLSAPNGVQGQRQSLETDCLKDSVGEEVLGIRDGKEVSEFPVDSLFSLLSLVPTQTYNWNRTVLYICIWTQCSLLMRDDCKAVWSGATSGSKEGVWYLSKRGCHSFYFPIQCL